MFFCSVLQEKSCQLHCLALIRTLTIMFMDMPKDTTGATCKHSRKTARERLEEEAETERKLFCQGNMCGRKKGQKKKKPHRTDRLSGVQLPGVPMFIGTHTLSLYNVAALIRLDRCILLGLWRWWSIRVMCSVPTWPTTHKPGRNRLPRRAKQAWQAWQPPSCT